MKKIFLIVLSLAIFSTVMTSCSEDSLEPSLEQNRDFILNPPSTVSDLQLLANGMHKRMVAVPYYGRDYVIFNECRTDNAYSTGASNRFLNVTSGILTASAAYPTDTWAQIYAVITNANLIINSTIAGDQVVVDDLKAQALTVRALAHFDLLKLYGQQNVGASLTSMNMSALGVPYVTTYRDLTKLTPARNTVAEVKQFIYNDLNAAIPKFIPTSLNYTKVNLQSAKAIKSRVAIYFSDWTIARDAASEALALGGSIVPESSFVSSFSADGKQSNSIFELVQLSNDNNGINGLFQIYGATVYGDIVLNNTVAFSSIFDATDVRRSASMISASRNIGKYTKFATNTKVIRYEEIVLNYAEALFETGNAPQALIELNKITSKRGAVAHLVASKATILLERRRELAFEGFRFDDLVRNGKGVPKNPNILAPFAYGDYRLAFPIPQAEMNGNPNMVQNFNF
jgi:hypothetical protein